MMTAESLSTITSLLSNAQSICIFFPAQTSADVILSATTFGRGLQTLGKSVTVSTPGLVAERLNQFAGVSDISRELGNKNLDVSFPYDESQVDKVSYHIDEESQTFHLVVQPRKGAKPLDSSAVSYSYTGAEADLIFTFGVDTLEDLEQIYFGYEQLFDQTTVVSVHSYDTQFGSVKLNTSGSASYAEVVAYMLQELGVTIDADAATSLLSAIESATQTFKSLSVTAQTFEIAGKLLATGARRVRIQEESEPAKLEQRANDVTQDSTLTKKQFAPVTSKDGTSQKPKPKNTKQHVPSNPGMRLS